MIQANELRVGNWVETVLSDKPQRVVSITAQQVKDGTFYLINTLLQDHLDPIPLTPEILEKCGFNKVDKTSYDKNFNGGSISRQRRAINYSHGLRVLFIMGKL